MKNVNDDILQRREQVSALADGELAGQEFAVTMGLMAQEADVRQTWHRYHLVGDLMREAQPAALVQGNDSAAFLARFQKLLAQESQTQPTETSNLIANNVDLTRANGLKDAQTGSANDASFRWKLLAGVASLATVAAVSWSVFGIADSSTGNAQLAQAVAAPPEVPQVMLRDPHLDALLAAHKQFGGTSALQMPAGFLRNATFEGESR
jgi:sigma-E factor negative regulatory protein RseA